MDNATWQCDLAVCASSNWGQKYTSIQPATPEKQPKYPLCNFYQHISFETNLTTTVTWLHRALATLHYEKELTCSDVVHQLAKAASYSTNTIITTYNRSKTS